MIDNRDDFEAALGQDVEWGADEEMTEEERDIARSEDDLILAHRDYCEPAIEADQDEAEDEPAPPPEVDPEAIGCESWDAHTDDETMKHYVEWDSPSLGWGLFGIERLDFWWQGDCWKHRLRNPEQLLKDRYALKAWSLLTYPKQSLWWETIDVDERWPMDKFGFKKHVSWEEWLDDQERLDDQYIRYLRNQYRDHDQFSGLGHVNLVTFVDERTSIANPLLTTDALRLAYASIRCEWLKSPYCRNDPGDIRRIVIRDRDPSAPDGEDAYIVCGTYHKPVDAPFEGLEVPRWKEEPHIVIYDSVCFSSQDARDMHLSLQGTLLHEIGHHVFQPINASPQAAECMAQWFAHKHVIDAKDFAEKSWPPAYQTYVDLCLPSFLITHKGTGWDDSDLAAFLLFQIEQAAVGDPLAIGLVDPYVAWYNNNNSNSGTKLIEAIRSAAVKWNDARQKARY